MAICDIYPQIRGKNGNYVDSQLFKDLMVKHKDRDLAKSIYRQVHSDVFMDSYGDWINNPLSINSKLDVNGEPLVETITEHIVDEIDYLPAEIQEVKKKSKYENLITLKKQQIRDIRAKIATNKTKSKDAPKERKKQLLKAIETLNSKVDKITDQIDELQTNEGLEYVYSLAEEELADASKLIKSGKMSSNEILFVDRILDTWTAAGDMNSKDHLFLEQEDFEHEGIVESLSNYRARAVLLGNELFEHKKEFLKKYVEDKLGKEFNEEDLLGDIVDISTIKKFVRDIQKVDHPIFRAIFTTVKSASLGAKHNTTKVWDNIDTAIDKALPILKKLNPNDPFKPFKQTTSDGKLTGNLTYLITQDFFNTIKRLRYNAFKSADSTSGARDTYNEFTNKNLIYFDPRLLLEDSTLEDSKIPEEYIYGKSSDLQEWVKEKRFTEAEKQAHISELKAQLGEDVYNDYLERFNEKIKLFKEERDVRYEMIFEGEGSNEAKKIEFIDWLKINSPYFALHSKEQINVLSKIENNKRIYYKGVKGFTYTYEVPRRIVDGKDSGWYDKNYETIASVPELKALHKTTMDILQEVKDIIPDGKIKGVQINTLPYIEKTIIDMFSEKGMKMGIAPFWDKLKEMSRASDVSDIIYDDVDPLNKQIKPQMRFGATLSHDKEINDYITLKEAEYLSKYPDASDSDLVEFRAKTRAEITDKIANRKSFDLGMVMKSYYLLAQSFKHKSLIEDNVRLAADMFKTVNAQKTNAVSEQYKDPNMTLLPDDKGVANMKEMLEYYLDSQLYNIPTKQIEGKTKHRVLTSEEKIKLDEINTAIEGLETLLSSGKIAEDKVAGIEFKLEKLNKQAKELGGYFAGSEFGDLLLKYNQLKNMGWNVLSAVANIGFGWISNFIEGSDGRLYNNKDLAKSYGLALQSMNAFWTGYKSDSALKIRSLMDDLDVLKDASYETFEKSVQSSFTRKVKKFGPYEPQKRSEYLNQATLMMAMMMHKDNTIKSKDGTEANLWTAFNIEGKLKEEFKTEENIKNWESENPTEKVKFQLRLDEVIKRNHGNYDPDSKMMKNKVWLTRALLQFRTWMLEGFASRFEVARPDEILGYEVKGRYRSYISKDIMESTDKNAFELMLFHTKQLVRKLLLFKNTQYSDEGSGFSETDAANMRKNLTEIVIYMALASVGLMFKAANDDDDKDVNLALNFLINQGNRLETDILMYTNPMEFERIQQSALPLASLLTDSGKWFAAVRRQFDPDRRTRQGGPFDGVNDLAIVSAEWIPLGKQVVRNIKNVKQAHE